MLKTDKLISEAISLPVNLRTEVIERLLRSLNPTSGEIDKLWAIETEKRVAAIRVGKVKMIPAAQVLKKIYKRLK